MDLREAMKLAVDALDERAAQQKMVGGVEAKAKGAGYEDAGRVLRAFNQYALTPFVQYTSGLGWKA